MSEHAGELILSDSCQVRLGLSSSASLHLNQPARRPRPLHLCRHPRRVDSLLHAHAAEPQHSCQLVLPVATPSVSLSVHRGFRGLHTSPTFSHPSLSPLILHLLVQPPLHPLLRPPTPSFNLLPEPTITHTHTDSCPNPPQPAAQHLILMPREGLGGGVGVGNCSLSYSAASFISFSQSHFLPFLFMRHLLGMIWIFSLFLFLAWPPRWISQKPCTDLCWEH